MEAAEARRAVAAAMSVAAALDLAVDDAVVLMVLEPRLDRSLDHRAVIDDAAADTTIRRGMG
jgi:hypothetical protein